MPKPLLSRLRPDSIAEFRAAARQRWLDGRAAAANNRRTAAIYLWGYASEMTIKAAYFALINFHSGQSITMMDLNSARNTGIGQHQILWPNPRKFHNVAAWAELLINVRQSSPLSQYADPAFAVAIRSRCHTVSLLWSEQLRYHKNYDLSRRDRSDGRSGSLAVAPLTPTLRTRNAP